MGEQGHGDGGGAERLADWLARGGYAAQDPACPRCGSQWVVSVPRPVAHDECNGCGVVVEPG